MWKWQSARRKGLVSCDVVLFWHFLGKNLLTLPKSPFGEKSVSGAAISNSYDSETEKKYAVSNMTLMM